MHSKIELKANQRILFIGDSITDAGRRDPPYQPLGNGYVHFVGNMLVAKHPHLNLEIINTGLSGDTTRGLKERWQRDCIERRPDVLSVLIGINDLWTQHADADYLPFAVYPDEYELTYRLLLSDVRRECNCVIVLMEPFMFCSDARNPMRKDLNNYIEVVHRLAREYDAVPVELQNRIDEEMRDVPARQWSSDSVHPYTWAQAWIAQRWLESTGL
ncbi:MAG: SGNH/GDSL hydrolase family protein [Sedimentisphaerales bacterium]|nr:SGNH/GDSL hydrolase family protein [Sedimentisphaerales bacterium]